jgi:septum site-determining protein MinD
MGMMIAIAGGKDGVGKTTFAFHLAYNFFKIKNQKVLIVDADVGNMGDLLTLVNARQSKTLFEFVQQSSRMDPKLTEQWIARHPLGVSVLGAAPMLTDFHNLDDAALVSSLKLLSRSYDLVIVDVGRDINPLSFRVFENSELIFVVTDSDIVSVNQSGEFIKRLRSLHFGNEQMRLVLNRFDPKSVVNPAVLKQKLNLEARVLLPADTLAFQQCVGAAKPLHLLNPKHPYLRSLEGSMQEIQSLEAKREASKSKATPSSQSLEVLRSVLPFTFGSESSSQRVPPRGATANTIMERNLSIRSRVHERLLELVDLRNMDALELEKNPKKKEELRAKTVQAVHQLLEEEAKEVQDRKERAGIAKDILDEALGLGPLEPLLASPEVTEIMVNSKDQIFVEQGGKIFLSDYRYTSEKHLMGCIERIVSPIGRRVDEKTPLCDARLKDGSRINVVIPPLALKGPTLTIRKFFKDKLVIDDLVRFGSLTDEMGDFLRAAVQAHLNIIVSGGTGTGKTTLLNLVSGFIPETERIVTVEDAAELQLPQQHVVTLEARPPNLQGEGAITIRDLVRNALRMRPDRIVVGECRSGEALDMLQAMNTGHDGSLTTIHSNNPRDCLRRIETLVMMAGFDLPIVAIREQIASAVHLIVQLRRLSDGSRKISHITEVMGMEGETIITQPIFEFKQTGTDEKGKVKGQFQASGLIPKFVETLKAKGIPLPRGLFGAASPPAASSAPAAPAGAAPAGAAPTRAAPTRAAPTRAAPTAPAAAGPLGARNVRPAGSAPRPGHNPQKIPVRTPPGGKK